MDWINKYSYLKWLVVILLAINIITLTIFWIYILDTKHPPEIKHFDKPHAEDAFIKKELNLSEYQAKTFEAKRNEFFSEADKLFNEMSELQVKLTNHLVQQGYPQDATDSIFNRIGIIQSTLERLRYNHFNELLSICSQDQKEKFIPIIKKVLERRPPDGDHKHEDRKHRDEMMKPPVKPNILMPISL